MGALQINRRPWQVMSPSRGWRNSEGEKGWCLFKSYYSCLKLKSLPLVQNSAHGSLQALLTNASLFTDYSESMMIKDLLCPQQWLSAGFMLIKSANKGIMKSWTAHSALPSHLSPLQSWILSVSHFTSTKSKGFITDLRHAHCHKLSYLWFKFKVKSKSHWI